MSVYEEFTFEIEQLIAAIDRATEPIEVFNARQAASKKWSEGIRQHGFRSKEYYDLWERIKA